MMTRRAFLKAIGGAITIGAVGKYAKAMPPAAEAIPPAIGKRPNIILIFCDDLGWGDLGAFWQNQRQAANRILTPHIDQAISEGIKLTQHLTVSPVCLPARASMMTGKNQGHCNLRDNTFDHAIDPHMTLATVMKAGGYTTWHIGKWGIGGGYQSGTPRTAMACQAGFDYSYGYPAHLHGHSYYHCYLPGKTNIDRANVQSPILESYAEAAYEAAGRPEGFERDQAPGAKTAQWRKPAANEEVRFVYDTDLFTAKAKALIDAHLGSSAPAPFFVHLCYTTVHGSGHQSIFDPAITCKQAFHVPGSPYPALNATDARWGGGATLDGSLKTSADTANTWIHPDFRGYATPSERRYATTVRRLDDAINDLLHFLRLRGIEQETLLVFTSDNGPAGEYLRPGGLDWVAKQGSAGPFRGMKRWSTEGGLREPTFARWPGTIPAGRTSNFPCNFTCWMPTFAQVAGLPPPAHSDGVSLLPLLTGHGTQLPCTCYTEYVDGGSGQNFGLEQSIRQGDWLLLRNSGKHNNAPELYHLGDDPGQTRNLAAERPDLVAQLLPLLVNCRIPLSQVPAACGAPTTAANRNPAREALDATPYQPLPEATPTPPEAAQGTLRLFRGTWPWVPDFRALANGQEVTAEQLATTLATQPGTDYGLLRHGCLTLSKPCAVTFRATGAGGCHLWLHEAHLLEWEAGDCLSGRAITVHCEAGRHPWRACLTAPFVTLEITPEA